MLRDPRQHMQDAGTFQLSPRVTQKTTLGAPGWLSELGPLPSAPVMVPGSWGRAPHQALCSAGSLFPPLSLPASLPTFDLSLCQINK